MYTAMLAFGKSSLVVTTGSSSTSIICLYRIAALFFIELLKNVFYGVTEIEKSEYGLKF